jgi:outer membrane murein-binding lipoprotein Lpp
MPDAAPNMQAPTNPSAESRPGSAGPQQINAHHTKPHGKLNADDPHVMAAAAAAASIDELLAKEALANLKRVRAAAHEETVKFKARVPIPAARLVVRPPTSHAWMTPFISLAAIVGLSTSLCAGGLAYLFLQPVIGANTPDAELRNLRETVAQLRRNVADLSNDVATTRTALTAANKAANDRLAHFTQDLERARRDQPRVAGRIDRATADGTQLARSATADTTDVTGTIQPPSPQPVARPEVIPGWRVRRAYDGIAVLEGGQYGVIEVVLGQDVPQLGRIQDIKYDNGRWQVLTTNGVINSGN